MKTTMIYLRQFLALCLAMVAFAACGDDDNDNGGNTAVSGIQLISIDKISCLPQESAIDINFTAGGEWAATSSATWLNLSKSNGAAGDVTITATIYENDSFDVRPATITIKDKGTGKEVTVSVKQAAKGTILFFSSESQQGMAFDNTKVSEENDAFVVKVNVTSNYDWSITTESSWLSYSKASTANEDGSYTVTFYADFNKLYESGQYAAQNAIAHFQYTTVTRAPATIDYQLEFKGITPTLTFDVEKAELRDEDMDGEYTALATVNSNIAWTFDSHPDFLESVEVLGENNSAKFLPASTRIKMVLKNSEIDTAEMEGKITFKDATTQAKLENMELPVAFAGVGDRYVTFDRSNFTDNDPSDMYPYFMFDAMGVLNEDDTFTTERKVEVTAGDIDNITVYAAEYNPDTPNIDEAVLANQVYWMKNYPDEAPLNRSKLSKTTLILKASDRGGTDWPIDSEPTKERFCAIFIVSSIEYPDFYSLFDGNDQLRKGLYENALFVGQKGKNLDFSTFYCEALNGNSVEIQVSAAGQVFEYPYEGLDPEEAQPSFVYPTFDDAGELINVDYAISGGMIEFGQYNDKSGFQLNDAGQSIIKITVGANTTGQERRKVYAIVANDGTEFGYLLTHFTLIQAAQ